MSGNGTASAGTGAVGWNGTPGGVSIHGHYSMAGRARQPSWQTSKREADRSWLAVRALLVGLGFDKPIPTRRDLDLKGVDVICADGRTLAWRNRAARYLSFEDCTFRVGRPCGVATEVHKWGSCQYALWTWADTSGALVAWLLLDCQRVTPLLSVPWRVTHMHDADFVAVPWAVLSEARAIVAASRNVRAGL